MAGVGIWLRAAHERGDAGEPGILVDRLTGIAEQTRALATQLGGLDVPEDTGPAIDVETLVQQVTAQLCRGGP